MKFGQQLFRSVSSLARVWSRTGIVAAATVLVLAACGQSPSIVLTLDAASAAVTRGSDVSVVVTLTRAGGASADVSLAISGLPANVTAQFSPATLTGGTLSSILTISAAAAAVEGDYDVTVTGSGTGLVDSAELALDVTSLSVTGRVASLLEIPVPGASVRSQGDSAVTDADGNFTLTGLSVPYDLAVWNQADEWVHIYEGLTATDLLVAPAATALPSVTSRSATVSGNLTGGVIPVAANQVVMVCAEGTDGIAIGCDTVLPTESAYSLSAQWFGPTTRAVRIHALQFQRDASGYPTDYLGYTTADLNLADTVPAAANLDLGTAVSSVTVDVDVVSPVAIVATIAALQIGPGLAIPVAQVSSPAITHQFAMPVIDGATYTFIAAVSIGQFGWQADVTSTTATVEVPDTLQLTAPADLAPGVTTSTSFTTSATSGPKTFMWNANGGGLAIGLTTMSSTTTIPDITPYGLALPANADFGWQAIGHGSDSTDDATASLYDYYNFTLMLTLASPGLNGEGTVALSDSRGFTTAP
ncbi:MAG TPA: hypothetical protein VFN03_05830 [Trueperaceae bacterium]|nr:hypothetical protein [Trueperaceae bacterium]